MAKIATCPKCAKQLGLPLSIAATDRAECPECHAVFSLSETVQISLPVARVLDPAEQPAAAAIALTDKSNESVADELASNTAPLKSWEERLKNALALDGSDNSATAASEESETLVKPEGTEAPEATEKTPSKSPSFEFELDPTIPAAVEPKPAILDRELPKPQPSATPANKPKPAAKRASTPPKTLADFATGELASASGITASTLAELPKQEKAETVEVAVQTVARRRVSRSAFPKIAALATGPLLGGFFGLYGLLWFQGAKADFVGLSRVLPASLLPADFGKFANAGSHDAVPIAEANSPGMMAEIQEPPAAVKRDEAVRPASAAQLVAPINSTVRIQVGEFSDLVEAATAALPAFTAGDLSTSGAIKRKGQAYMALCRLAEQFDFARQPGLAPAVKSKAQQAALLYRQTASLADLRPDLAHIAGRWWEYDKRPTPGIFLAGEVQRTQPAGDGILCWVKLDELSTVPPIPVWFKQGRYQTGDQVGVVGSVISSPDDMPPGFSGKQAVDASYDFAL